VPWLKKHQQLIRAEDLPTPEEKLDILKMTIELLSLHGYEYIGMDHFAKPTDELSLAQKEKTLYRNFQGYSTRSGADLYGFGMSSISHFQNIYAQNEKNLQDYYAAIEGGRLATHVGYRMTEDDHIRKYVIMRLMCDLELNTSVVEEGFDIDFHDYFESSLQQLERFAEDGLVEITPGRLRIVGAGRLLLRNIAMCFDAYLDTIGKTKQVFSRTV
jgi:oxygen-independent coproporphyrinogen-3 oxidase